MCYLLYLSTDSQQDLTKYNNESIKFEKVIGKDEESLRQLLNYSNIWYVGSSTGCSCSFRHLMEPGLGFSEPVDWYEEEEEDIEATKQIYHIFKELLLAGNKVECFDKWESTDSKNIETRDVSLSQVSCTEFRFIENYIFGFTL